MFKWNSSSIKPNLSLKRTSSEKETIGSEVERNFLCVYLNRQMIWIQNFHNASIAKKTLIIIVFSIIRK